KLRQFARASGVLAKSDPLDARMIASFVAIMPTRPAQRTPAGAAQVAEILAVRRQLSAEKGAAENASRLLEDAMLRRLGAGLADLLAISICSTSAWSRSCKRSRARPPLPTAHLHAGSRIAVGLYADRAFARARLYQSQAGRCIGRRCAIRVRERHAQGQAVH